MLKREEFESLLTIDPRAVEHIETYKVIALVELRQTIESNLEDFSDRIECLALAITDQTDKLSKELAKLKEWPESMQGLRDSHNQSTTAIIKLQKDILRLQTQVAAMARSIEAQQIIAGEHAHDIMASAGQVQDLAIALEEIQNKIS